jgi:hypothetical protein
LQFVEPIDDGERTVKARLANVRHALVTEWAWTKTSPGAIVRSKFDFFGWVR